MEAAIQNRTEKEKHFIKNDFTQKDEELTKDSDLVGGQPLPIGARHSVIVPNPCVIRSETSPGSSTDPSDPWRESPDSIIDRLRFVNREHLNVLCRSYITSLVNCPELELLLEDETRGSCVNSNGVYKNGTRKSGRRTRTFSLTSSSKKAKLQSQANGGIFGSQLTKDGIEKISQLIDFLSREENLNAEGLFRKSGNVARQKELKILLETGSDFNLKAKETDGIPYFSAHDCANVLKSFLGELPEPLLQEKYFNAHCQVPELSDVPLHSGEKNKTKKKTALQLLFLLLPRDSYLLLRKLLLLLHRVVAHSDSNRMTSESLGTLFAPHVLCPRKMAPTDLQNQAPLLSRAVAFMIVHVDALFQAPPELVQSAEMFLRRRANPLPEKRSYGSPFKSHPTDLDSSTEGLLSPVASKSSKRHRRGSTGEKTVNILGSVASNGGRGRHPSSPASSKVGPPDSPGPVDAMFRFVDQKKAEDEGCTRKALQELYINIQSMPEGPKKRKYMKMMQKSHGVGNPIPVPVEETDDDKECDRRGRKHNRSRSIGEALGNFKRALSRGRQHQRSRSSSRNRTAVTTEPADSKSPTDNQGDEGENSPNVTPDDSPKPTTSGPWVHRQRMTPSNMLSPIAMSPMDHTPIIAAASTSTANIGSRKPPILSASGTPHLPSNAVRVLPDQRTQRGTRLSQRTQPSCSSPFTGRPSRAAPFGETLGLNVESKTCGTPHGKSGTVLPRGVNVNIGPEKFRSPLPSRFAINATQPQEISVNVVLSENEDKV